MRTPTSTPALRVSKRVPTHASKRRASASSSAPIPRWRSCSAPCSPPCSAGSSGSAGARAARATRSRQCSTMRSRPGGRSSAPAATMPCSSAVVAEPAHAHALRVRHPALAVARRSGLEQERHEDVGLYPGEATLGERRAQRRAHPPGALDAQQRPRAARRHGEALLGVVIEAAEAPVKVQAPDHDVGQQRRDAREAARFHPHGQPQAPIEIEGVRGFEVVLERGDLLIERERRHRRTPPQGDRRRPAGVVHLAAFRAALGHRLGLAGASSGTPESTSAASTSANAPCESTCPATRIATWRALHQRARVRGVSRNTTPTRSSSSISDSSESGSAARRSTARTSRASARADSAEYRGPRRPRSSSGTERSRSDRSVRRQRADSSLPRTRTPCRPDLR